MKHLMAALLILASLGAAGEGKALEFRRPPTVWNYATQYEGAASPAVIYVALPLAYICTNDCQYRTGYSTSVWSPPFDFGCYQNSILPIRNSGSFDTVVYVGYFVVSQPPEQKIPDLTWHPAPEFSAPVYQEPVLKSVANDMAMLPQRMADSTTREKWESKELLDARRWWWRKIFWELFPNTVILGKPGDPPNPAWRPHFKGSFKTSCAKILAADLPRKKLLEKFVTGDTLLNPLPGMKLFKARLFEDF